MFIIYVEESVKKKKGPQEVSGSAELAVQSSSKRAKVRKCSEFP